MALAATTDMAPTYSDINLVPLRINVVSDDNSLSIVETLVLDRNVWPIPLFYPLEEAIERNADELAYMVLTDMEVHGMGRTVRHFTGRVEFWTTSLQQKIKAQLIPQLRHVALSTKLRVVKMHLSPSISGAERWKKRPQRDPQDDGEESAPIDPKRRKRSSLVPVRLRLCVNGVRIHDDFIWDLSVPQCPIEFACSLGKDLNLSDEATAAIVTSIVEQLDGSSVDDTKDLEAITATSTNGSAAATPRKNASAAWALEHKVHIANMQQLLTMHRPTGATVETSKTNLG